MGLAEQNKEEKRQRLLDAAYELFLEKGSVQTTIDDIVKRGRVAKGTFYLYFQDKTTIHDALTLRISRKIIGEAVEYAEGLDLADLPERILAFVDYTIEYFKNHTEVLKLVQHNFNWMLIENELGNEDSALTRRIRETLLASEDFRGRSPREIRDLIFVLTQMVGSVCFSSIIKGRPGPIDELKPMLYEIIKRSIALDAPALQP